MRKHLSLLVLMLMACMGLAAQQPVSIIPLPQSLVQHQGSYQLTAKTAVSYSPQLEEQASWLAHLLRQSTGWDLRLLQGPRKGGISLTLDTVAVPQPEAYSLQVTPKEICIKAHDQAGAFYALQSMLQLLPPQARSRELQQPTAWTMPCVDINDAPAHPYRGYMLDVSRYYYDMSFLRKCVDWMSAYKLNKLQLHLIDDAGWRLEIKKYPRLTEVGAWAGDDTHRLGGYYTQEQMRDFIHYAAVRGVEVIPEIEFPAHILSAVVAYPWLSCTGEQHEVQTEQSISEEILCVGKDSVMQFLRDVLDETVALFPSRYINIGGDEAVYKRWEACPRCQALMKREGITKASELQGYLTNVVNEYLSAKGRTVVGWEEIMMRGKVTRPLVAMTWHDPADSIKAKEAGLKCILASSSYMYFDFPESHTPGEVKAATWLGPISLQKAYSTPLEDYSPQSTTIGVQGCLWSDQFIHGTQLQEIPNLDENRSERYVEYLTFPRLWALSEVAWTAQAKRSFPRFQDRASAQYARLDAMECNYRVPEPLVVKEVQNADASWDITLKSPVQGATVRYTLNGRYPTVHSTPCPDGTSIHVKDRKDLRAITVVTQQHYSLPLILAE